MFDIYINGEKIPMPTQWDESYTAVETVNQTEDGYDQIDLVRYGKLTVSASMQTTSFWKDKMYAFSKLRSFTLVRPDPDGLASRTVRIRDFNASKVQYSEKVQGTSGLWTVTFSIYEF